SSTTRWSVHSMLMGDSATRGDFTRVAGTALSPVSASSSTSTGQSPDASTTRAARDSVTMLTTKSPVAWMLRNVSLGSPPRRLTETPISGGRLVSGTKYENGAALWRPSALTEEMNAIGRGTIMWIMWLYIDPGEMVLGSRITRGLRSGGGRGRASSRAPSCDPSGRDTRS